MNKLLFGSDPEAFFSRVSEDGSLYVVPPAKYRFDFNFRTDNSDPRHPVFATADGQNGVVKIFEDGAAIETSMAPSTDIRTLYQDIQLGYQLAKEVAEQFGDSLSVIPAINFDINEFRDRVEDFQETLVFGCDPDMDVFEMEGLVETECRQESALDHPLRYGGGHLHISGCENFRKKPLLAVKMCAFLLGNLVTFSSPMKELDHLRTYRYGKPGRFRLQEYGKKWNNLDWTDIGIEYRTPSNAWTTDLSLGQRMAAAAQIIADFFLPQNDIMESLIEDIQERTIEAVMKGLPELAEDNYKVVMSWVD